MTKVDIAFKLARPLDDAELKRIAHIHSVYGMFVLRVNPQGDELFVQYDGSRLSPKEVQGTLEENGIPLR